MTLGLSKPPHPNQAEDRRFYERRGFTRATEIILPGGPPTWWLRRAPTQMLPRELGVGRTWRDGDQGVFWMGDKNASRPKHR